MAAEPRKLVFSPGVARDASQLEAKGAWWDCSLVRFRSGMPEKFGGWVRFGTQAALGTPRSLLSYFFLTGDAVLGVGTSTGLFMSQGGTLFDITPERREISVTNGFLTVSGSAIVTLEFGVVHEALVGDRFLLPAFSFGGITFGGGVDGFGGYEVLSVPSSTSITFDAGALASSTSGPGGGVRLVTLLWPTGPVGVTAGLGWGAGPWSRKGWGDPALSSTITSGLRYWSLAKWGERLLSVPAVGPLFAFTPSITGTVNSRAAVAVNSRDGQVASVIVTAGGSGYVSTPTVVIAAPPAGVTATAVANMAGQTVASITIVAPGSGYITAPAVSFSGGGGGSGAAATALLEPIRSPSLVNSYVVVGATERRAILLGSGDLGDDTNFDPMLIRWSDLEDYTNFYPEPASSAGLRRAQEGSRLVAGCNLTLMSIVWSDTAAHQMRFVGAPYWYAVEVIGRNCGLVGPGAFTEMGGAVYWMGQNSFWMWRGGAPVQLQCTYQEAVFSDINRDQIARVSCGTNISSYEVIWFYPSMSSPTGECDRYVIFNASEGRWYGGVLSRTAWIDAAAVDRPLAADPSGLLYQHETGVDADGAAMGEFIESGFVDIADGEPFSFIERIIPDWQRLSGAVRVYVKVQDDPGGFVRQRGPYNISATTRFVGCRSRGRALALRIEGVGAGGDWRMGQVRGVVGGVGKR